jgi:hypothetical protein
MAPVSDDVRTMQQTRDDDVYGATVTIQLAVPTSCASVVLPEPVKSPL